MPFFKDSIDENECFLAKLAHGLSFSLFDKEDCSVLDSTSGGVSVKITDVTKTFNNHSVLKGINLDIKPGETFCLIGPSGTGKSVLLKLIARLDDCTSGNILINSNNISNNPKSNRDFRFSMVFQTSALFGSLTVEENVGLWLREKRICAEAKIKEMIQEKLKLVGLPGIEHKKILELSGGMKKRVAIARALIMNPDLILYDEPTAELDPVSADELAVVIKKLKNRVSSTSIIVTHDLNFAFHLADRIAMIDDGKIIAIGSPDEIRNTDNETVKNFIYTTTKGINGDI